MAPACVDICRPSATSANEQNRLPPTISTTIITPHRKITAQTLRSFCSCPLPRKTWLCPSRNGVSLAVFTAEPLFKIAVDNIEELLAGLDIRGCAGEMGLYMILYDLAQQAIHRSAAAGNALQYVRATDLLFQRALNGLDLTANPTDTVQKLGFLTDGMTHSNRIVIRMANSIPPYVIICYVIIWQRMIRPSHD